MQRQLPILIFAQSARFMAESATLAGYSVWVADCFCDSDTVAVAQRHLTIPSLSALTATDFFAAIETLSRGEPCQLVIGTGIEQLYPLIELLPANILYLGNTVQTLSLLRQAKSFFPLLDSLKLAFPSTQFQRPVSNHATWLYKDLSGYGGQSIQSALTVSETTNGYYQAFITGQSASVLFLANGEQAHVLGYNRLVNVKNQFRLAEIRTPLNLSNQLEQQLQKAINNITQATKLKGLCSLDFIFADNAFSILEINPRFSASAELTTHHAQLFQWHLNALNGEIPTNTTNLPHSARLLVFFYAEQNSVVIDHPVWPESCHDLPAAGSYIQQGSPVCTIIIEAETHADCQQALQKQHLLVQQNLCIDS